MLLCAPGSVVLVLCPHPDDEIGSGGLISLLAESGMDVRCIYFSTCAQSTTALGFSPSQLINECRASCATLGVSTEKITSFNFPVRHFPQYRQDILEELVALRRQLKPTIVLVPAGTDNHQDHATIAQEAARAFKDATILGYEFPWNQKYSRVDVLVRLKEAHITKKMRAWSSYKTQASRLYFDPVVLISLARIRGIQANCEFAEAYEVTKIVL